MTLLGIEPFRQGKLPITELRKKLRKTTWNYLSIIRTHASGQKASAQIDSISTAVADASVETVYDLVSFYELKSMLTTARLIVAGSLARKESRGSHFRSDYPKTDDENFKGSFFYGKKDDRLKMMFRPVDG